MSDENSNNKLRFRVETIIVVVSLMINFAVMIEWFTALERRLTRIETTIDIKLNNSQQYYPPIFKERSKVKT